MDLDERLERASPVSLAEVPHPGSEDAERIYRAALRRLEASSRPPGGTWKRADRASTRVGKGITPRRELVLLASIVTAITVVACQPPRSMSTKATRSVSIAS
jgi:hypothetical protein